MPCHVLWFKQSHVQNVLHVTVLTYKLKITVTAIKFAHDDKYRLSCSSDDATLSVCLLMPSPPSVLCTLRGHLAEVTGK